jgi:L-ascorbate metabolism protein UlaG (beta-lactamase superfamily)
MGVTLDWLGCATFRLTIDDLVIFLDAYMDRLATARPVGLSSKDVDRGDFVLVGHSHFDHLAGAEVIARNTGAKIVGSNETCRVMREHQVPREQLLPSQGGERHRLGPGVTARAVPSLHACLWAGPPGAMDNACAGDLGLTEDDRAALFAERSPFRDVFAGKSDWARAALEHMRSTTGSFRDGGALAYLIETPYGAIFYQDTSGCWSGVLRDLRADAAILAASGRANYDGEPFQGSMAQFVAMEAAFLNASTIVLGHHDNWLGAPDFTPPDMAPLRAELGRAKRGAVLIEQDYLAATPLLAGA